MYSAMNKAYVYCVKVDGIVRYIGKGRNGRLRDHERVARSMNAKREKGRRVRGLRFHQRLAKAIRQGATVQAEVICEGLTDDEAYALEAEIIKSYPPGHLWNFMNEARGPWPEEVRRRWQEPAYRQKQSEATTARWENPEAREYMLRRHAEAMAVVDREAMSDVAKALWQDPDFRVKQLAKWDCPDFRKRHREAVVASITDDKRQEFGRRVAQSWRNPVKREARLKAMRERGKRQFETSGMMDVLKFIAVNGPCRYRDIAAVLGRSGTGSRIARLVKRGLIEKQADGLYAALPSDYIAKETYDGEHLHS